MHKKWAVAAAFVLIAALAAVAFAGKNMGRDKDWNSSNIGNNRSPEKSSPVLPEVFQNILSRPELAGMLRGGGLAKSCIRQGLPLKVFFLSFAVHAWRP